MRVVLLGPPGSGKGTQAAFIKKEYGIPHISTGDIFRKEISEKTPLGIEANKYIENGQLVPDDITIGIVKDRIMEDDCKRGFLLDGFPRTVCQAEALSKLLDEENMALNGVVNIKVPDESLINRLSSRRVCNSCGASYNLVFNPPKKEGICDHCSSKLIHRDDDTVETVKKRLAVYEKSTKPLIEYYEKKGLLADINGDQDIAKVFQDICNALGSEN